MGRQVQAVRSIRQGAKVPGAPTGGRLRSRATGTRLRRAAVAGRLTVVVASAILLLLAAAVPALATVYDPSACAPCHAGATPGIVTQFERSAMHDAGLTCADCHGTDHTAIWNADGQVPAGTCAQAGCHPDRYAEWTVKDGDGTYVNKHALGWTKMTAAARYIVMPEAQRYEMCERCHNIGVVADDGSVGKCDSCHTRHVFSAEEAREPEACGTCHMGPDHEQIDMWEKSKHGVVYQTEKGRPGGDPSRAPTCVTCHMPELENGPGQPLIHDVSTNITYGTVAQGARLPGTALPVPMRTITVDQAYDRRVKMLDVCDDCHAGMWAESNLDQADEIKRDVDDLLWDPVLRIRGLWYDGLLNPMPENRPPNPVYQTLGVNSGLVLVLGGQQLYGGTSAIEQQFFQTYKYDHVNTFKGAYHINPDYSHWFGWARVNPDLDLIKGEEARLRSMAAADPGFLVDPDVRVLVSVPASVDARRLEDWGNSSPNTFEWYFGDGGSPATGIRSQHTYAAPGRYTVQLTCADTALVNDAANPTTCAGKRTTTRTVVARYDSALGFARIPAAVRPRTRIRLTARLIGDGPASGSLNVLRWNGARWVPVMGKDVTISADALKTVAFSYRVTRTSRLKLSWSGDAGTWPDRSAVRTVKVRR